MWTLTDGEREILDELQEWDAEGLEVEADTNYSGHWCHGCDEPVEGCRCRPSAAPASHGRTPMERALKFPVETHNAEAI